MVQNSIKAKSREIRNNPKAYIIGKFVRKNWKILTTIAVCLLIWANISGSDTRSLTKDTSNSSIRSQENIYRGTQIARQEFIKYSKSERLRIQKFLKDNFGYKSTIDGLWGKKTASSYLRAANRYVNGKSLYSVNNVNVVFHAALNKQKSTPRVKTSNNQKISNQTSNQLETAIENILMLGVAKALLGNGNSTSRKVAPIFNNNGQSYSYGNNGNTIYNPGGNSKFSYGSNGALYYNPGSCPVKPCN
ncbi:hypothetical protein GN286_16485 [Rhodobacteraceae bacterium IMCC15231]|nr:hypothetical protein [Rhodobacteraceae bacterium IMCC15231]